MTDYTKLVKALRCKRDDCEGCDLAFLDNDEGWMCQYAAKDDDAAAAIEELQAEIRESMQKCAERGDRMVEPKLVKALRYCEFGWSARTCDNCEYSKTDCTLLLRDAAAAIEALQAEVKRLEPKRGEWIGRQNHKKCSVCGKQAIYDVALYTDMKTPYCPHCGAKMEDA